MSPAPTGRHDGRDLVISRAFTAPIEDVWASVTEPERTARWFGTWRGEGRPGKTVQVQMGFEEGEPWCDMHVHACEPPRLLVVAMAEGDREWRMELRLEHADGVTELTLVHRDVPADSAPSVGPGWEYYLDMLVAARAGEPLPSFDDYYPAQAAPYGASET